MDQRKYFTTNSFSIKTLIFKKRLYKFPISFFINLFPCTFLFQYANFRQDTNWQDYHARRRVERYHREREGQDPGQGGHPSGPAAPDFRRQAAGGRPHAL